MLTPLDLAVRGAPLAVLRAVLRHTPTSFWVERHPWLATIQDDILDAGTELKGYTIPYTLLCVIYPFVDPRWSADCKLLVRGIGDIFGSDEELKLAFSRFGAVLQATVRRRHDHTGRDTSWALVTMSDAACAMAAVHGVASPLRVETFNAEAAQKSSGRMSHIAR